MPPVSYSLIIPPVATMSPAAEEEEAAKSN
jgi:hypothetical protein